MHGIRSTNTSAQVRRNSPFAIALGLGTLLACFVALSVSSQELTEADQVEGMDPSDTAILYRQSVFYLMQAQLGQLKRLIVADGAEDRESIATISQQLSHTAELTGNAFGNYAALGFDIPTTASADIWDDAEGFAEAVAYLQSQTAELAAVAEVNAAMDQAALKAALAAVGKSCKACHEDFRTK